MKRSLILPGILGTLYASQAWPQAPWLTPALDGGPLNLIVAAPTATRLLYAIGQRRAGQVFLTSSDGGYRWRQTALPQGYHSIHGLRTGVVDSATVYLFGKQADADKQTVLRSHDSGASWRALSQVGGFVEKLHLTATSSALIAMTVDSLPGIEHYFPLRLSKDNGTSWTNISVGLPDSRQSIGYYDWIFDREYFPRALALTNDAAGNYYALISTAFTQSEFVSADVPGGGVFTLTLFTSSDPAGPWQAVGDFDFDFRSFFPTLEPHLAALRFAPADPDRLYAIVAAHYVFRSDDRGRSWYRTSANEAPVQATISAIAVNPVAPNEIYLATLGEGVLKSADEGRSWRPLTSGLPHPVVRSLSAVAEPALLYAATDAGAAVTNGSAWGSLNNGNRNDFVSDLLTLPEHPGALLATTNNNGLYLSESFGQNWREITASVTRFPRNQGVVVKPGTDGFIYAYASSGSLQNTLFVSDDLGATWAIKSLPTGTFAELAVDLRDSRRLLALVRHRDDTNLLGAANFGLYLSDNSGTSWRRLPADGLPEDYLYAAHDLAISSAADRFFLALSYTEPYSGIYRSDDAGLSWTQMLEQPSGLIEPLLPHRQNPDVIYAGSQARGILKSTNGGLSWTQPFKGLPPGDINSSSLRLSQSHADGVYVSTRPFGGAENQLYYSADQAVSWRLFDPAQITTDAVIHKINSDTPLLSSQNWRSDRRGLMNISTRGHVGQGSNALRAGFIVLGPEPVRLLLKGEGAILGTNDAIADPLLVLTTLDGEEIHRNDNWRQDTGAAEIAALAPPLSEHEAAFVIELEPGAYIAELTSNSDSGTGLVAVSDTALFDTAPTGVAASPAGVVNLSTQGWIETDDGLQAGFIIQGQDPVTVLIKGEGPILNVDDALADPVLTLENLAGVELMRNDDWRDHPSAARVAMLAPPASDRESAFLIELQPGSYIARLTSKYGALGRALIAVSDERALDN